MKESSQESGRLGLGISAYTEHWEPLGYAENKKKNGRRVGLLLAAGGTVRDETVQADLLNPLFVSIFSIKTNDLQAREERKLKSEIVRR